MTSRAKILPNYTIDDYFQWEGKWELIEGIPYAMSPAASPRHQIIANNIGFEFKKVLDTNKCGCSVYQPIDLKISEHTVLNPDLLIVCEPIEKQVLDFPPYIVVEILSPSTHLKDKITKYDLYENFGIKYYIIIDHTKEEIILYKLNESGKYVEIKDSIFDLKDCTISPNLKAIW